jgi:hypothetical protein
LHKDKSRKKKVVQLAELPSNPKLINFAEIALGTECKSGLDVYREWYDSHIPRPPKRPFTPA